MLRAHALVRRLRPRVVLATGGFVALPVVAGRRRWRACRSSCTSRRRSRAWPTGIAARLARRVAVSFAESARHFPAGRVVVTGNPLRPDLRAGTRADAVARFGLDPALPLIYVTGGAQGAHAINRAVGAIAGDLLAQAQVIHQCGDNRETGDLRLAAGAARGAAAGAGAALHRHAVGRRRAGRHLRRRQLDDQPRGRRAR